jgi:hypothetical protein
VIIGQCDVRLRMILETDSAMPPNMRLGGSSVERTTRNSASSCPGRSGMNCDRSLNYLAATSSRFQVPPIIVASYQSLSIATVINSQRTTQSVNVRAELNPDSLVLPRISTVGESS